MKNATATPAANSRVLASANGMAKRFSLGRRPGVMKRQSWKAMNGMASSSPTVRDSRMRIDSGSSGLRAASRQPPSSAIAADAGGGRAGLQ